MQRVRTICEMSTVYCMSTAVFRISNLVSDRPNIIEEKNKLLVGENTTRVEILFGNASVFENFTINSRKRTGHGGVCVSGRRAQLLTKKERWNTVNMSRANIDGFCISGKSEVVLKFNIGSTRA